MIKRKRKHYRSESKDILYSAMHMARIYTYLSEIERKQRKLDSIAHEVEYPLALVVGPEIEGKIRFKAISWSSMDATHKMTYHIRDKKLDSKGIYNVGKICGVEIWGGKDHPSGYSISIYDIIYEEIEDNGYPFWPLRSYLCNVGFSNVMNYYGVKTEAKLREDDG